MGRLDHEGNLANTTNHRAQTPSSQQLASLAPAWIPPEAWVILRRGGGGRGGGGRGGGRRACGGPLTPKEMQVLQGMMAGLGMNTIAQRMAIKPGTVKGHRLSLYRKLGCRPPEPPDKTFEPHTIVARAWEIIEGARKEGVATKAPYA